MNDRLLGLLGISMRAGKVTCGMFQTEKALDEGKVRLCVASMDIGDNNKRRIEYKCREKGVRLIFYSNTDDLSKSVGKQNMPVAGITDEGLSAAIAKIYGGADK